MLCDEVDPPNQNDDALLADNGTSIQQKQLKVDDNTFTATDHDLLSYEYNTLLLLPAPPTIHKFPFHPMHCNGVVPAATIVESVLIIQSLPSYEEYNGEVVPFAPTANHCDPFHATDNTEVAPNNPTLFFVQVIPSFEYAKLQVESVPTNIEKFDVVEIKLLFLFFDEVVTMLIMYIFFYTVFRLIIIA
jgi:hypothetical protein